MPSIRKQVSRKIYLNILILVSIFSLSACAFQAPLSQGNLINEEDIEKIEIGMTRNQVRFLFGTPMIEDPFHTDRWDYIYYLRIGREKATFKRWMSIFFEDDKVSRIVKDQELSEDL